MKTLSNEYKKFMIEDITTIVTCFKITLENGKKMGFTTHTRDIVFKEEDDLVYKTTSYTPTASSKTSALSVDNLDTELIIDHNDIKESDLEKGIYNNAKVEYFRCNYNLPFSKIHIEKIIKGFVSDVSKKKGIYNLEIVSLTYLLQTKHIQLTKATCDAQFADKRCNLNKEDYTTYTTVESVLDNYRLVLSNATSENLKHGIIEFISGDAYLQKLEIKDFDFNNRVLTLFEACNFKIQNGDEVKLIDGCDKLKETCKTKYNNIYNFRGFSFVPGAKNLINN